MNPSTEQYTIENDRDLEALMVEIELRFGITVRLDTYAFQGQEFDIGDQVTWTRNEHGGWHLDVVKADA